MSGTQARNGRAHAPPAGLRVDSHATRINLARHFIIVVVVAWPLPRLQHFDCICQLVPFALLVNSVRLVCLQGRSLSDSVKFLSSWRRRRRGRAAARLMEIELANRLTSRGVMRCGPMSTRTPAMIQMRPLVEYNSPPTRTRATEERGRQ